MFFKAKQLPFLCKYKNIYPENSYCSDYFYFKHSYCSRISKVTKDIPNNFIASDAIDWSCGSKISIKLLKLFDFVEN